MEMIMTAGMVTADEAYRTGLVNHVVPQAELLEFCNGVAQKIMKNSPLAISKAIIAINANYKDGENGFETEIKSFGKCFGTGDFKEGTTAFLEKRKAVFSGK
jgi:enoyl-CoA hydratase